MSSAQQEVIEPASAVAEQAFNLRLRQGIEYAFQPIVSLQTGTVYGYEALMRGVEALGFTSAWGLLNYAARQGWMASVDLTLHELALRRFAQIPKTGQFKCFFNISPHILALGPRHQERIETLLVDLGLPHGTLHYDMTLCPAYIDPAEVQTALVWFRQRRRGLALDDFGAGPIALQGFYDAPPTMVKLDRFFVDGLAKQTKKKLFLTHLVGLAHVADIKVVAKGVEEELDFLACKELGCDLMQGHLIAQATTHLNELRPRYEEVSRISLRDRRTKRNDRNRIETWMEDIPPICVEAAMPEVFDHFSRHKNHSYFPVLDGNRYPIGVIRESDIKGFVYSSYGKDLLANRAYRKRLDTFLTSCPTVDLRETAEQILNIYASNSDTPGLMVVDDFVYQGFLSGQALLRLLHEKNIGLARDQNPLTKLPGNNALFDYLHETLDEAFDERFYVYFDFDNFKPFNDTFGFRQGDRVILLFAELIGKFLSRNRWFVAHIGGDDFFAGCMDCNEETVVDEVDLLLTAFAENAASFYDQTSRSQGYIVAEDRAGNIRQFPLIGCSAAIIIIAGQASSDDVEALTSYAAKAKKLAKAASSGIYVWRV